MVSDDFLTLDDFATAIAVGFDLSKTLSIIRQYLAQSAYGGHCREKFLGVRRSPTATHKIFSSQRPSSKKML